MTIRFIKCLIINHWLKRSAVFTSDLSRFLQGRQVNCIIQKKKLEIFLEKRAKSTCSLLMEIHKRSFNFNTLDALAL